MQLEKQQEIRNITIIKFEYAGFTLKIINRGFEFALELIDKHQNQLNKVNHIQNEKELRKNIAYIFDDYFKKKFESWYKINKVVDSYVDHTHLTKAEYLEQFKNLKYVREIEELKERVLNEYESI